MAISLRIELSHMEPLIWRKIRVWSDISLADLHLVIQGAMGWQNSHLHVFLIDGKRYDQRFDDLFPSEIESFDEQEFQLAELVKLGGEFQYIYDFGDDWHHRVVVEAMDDEIVDGSKCIGGERACPPEDCGGPFGFPEFLESLSDNAHPYHEETAEWAGDFDPEAFSIEVANKHIVFLKGLAAS